MFSGYYSRVGGIQKIAIKIFVLVLENIQLVIAELRVRNVETGKFIIASATDIFSQFGMLYEGLRVGMGV